MQEDKQSDNELIIVNERRRSQRTNRGRSPFNKLSNSASLPIGETYNFREGKNVQTKLEPIPSE